MRKIPNMLKRAFSVFLSGMVLLGGIPVNTLAAETAFTAEPLESSANIVRASKGDLSYYIKDENKVFDIANFYSVENDLTLIKQEGWTLPSGTILDNNTYKYLGFHGSVTMGQGYGRGADWIVFQFDMADNSTGDAVIRDADGNNITGYCYAAGTDGFWVGHGERSYGGTINDNYGVKRFPNYLSTTVGPASDKGNTGHATYKQHDICTMLFEKTTSGYVVETYINNRLLSTENYSGTFNGIGGIQSRDSKGTNPQYYGSIKIYSAPTADTSGEITLEKSTLGNPIAGFDGSGNIVYAGDPAMLVDGDTVYLYVGHDDTGNGGGYTMPNYLCYSSKDMVNWQYRGSVMEMTSVSWADNVSAWASQVLKYGNYYYLFYCAEKPGTGKCTAVARATSPTGPFVDQGILISPEMTNTTSYGATGRKASFGWEDIDPTVWVENGHIYLMWGNSNCWMCELTMDMKVKDIDGNGRIEQGKNKDIWYQEITGIERIPSNNNTNDIVDFTEAPWLYRRKDANGNPYGQYYVFFAMHWREEMAYATSDSLSNNKWTYRGKLMEPSATANTNHPCVIDFKGKTYFVYHNGSLPGGSGYRRVICVEELKFNQDGSIDYIQETSTGISGTATQIIDYGGKFVAHEDFSNPLDDVFYPITGKLVYPAEDAKTANLLWEIEPGKANKNKGSYVSIEAYNKPGMYLTATADRKVVLSHDHNNDKASSAYGITADSNNMTFRTLKGATGEGVTFESVAYPGYYITSTPSGLILSNNKALARSYTFDLNTFTGNAEEDKEEIDTSKRCLAKFNFDSDELGFTSENAKAVGYYTLQDHNNGKAVYLNGANKNYLNISSKKDKSLLTGVEEMTVSLWAKPTAGTTNWLFFASKDEKEPTADGNSGVAANQRYFEHYLGILDNNGTIIAERYANTGTRPTSAQASVSKTDWYHLTVVHTKTEIILYVNGTEVKRQASNYSLKEILGDDSSILVGKATWGGGEYYTGLVDDLSIYNYTVSAAEVRTLYQGGELQESETVDIEKKILAEFTFDDMQSGFLSENAKATNNGMPELSTDAKCGNSLNLSGASNYLTVTDSTGKSLLTDCEELTVSYWSKVNNDNANWAFYMAPDDVEQTYGYEKYVGILEDKGSALITERYNNSNGTRPAYPSTTFTKNVWKYVTVVYGKDKITIYVDGQKKAEQQSGYSIKGILGKDSICYIGKANWGSGEYFNGLIDEVTIYNYAMDDQEVNTLYQSYDLRADKVAADAVFNKIDAIGEVEYTTLCKEKIDEAKAAYNGLTEAQKALVTNYNVLIAAEARYQELKAEKEEEEANQTAANAVIDMINAIGTVEFTDDCKEKIDEAKAAYNRLSAEQKALVTNVDTLTAAENTYQDLLEDYEAEQEANQAANQAAANVVIGKINAIGTVELTDACKNKIDDARMSYDNLTPAQKSLVTNLSTLTTAERTYQQLVDEEKNQADSSAATAVILKILNIGTVTLDPSCKEKIDDARNAYDNLTEAQKAGVFNLSTLLAAEAKYQQLLDEQNASQGADQAAANVVMAKIDAIGNVTLTDACKALIDDANASYNHLTDAQKDLVTNLNTLILAEARYQELVDQEKTEADSEAAMSVILKILNIGTVKLTDACKEKIDIAREAYDQLSAAQKGLVINLETLIAAEDAYKKLQEEAEQDKNENDDTPKPPTGGNIVTPQPVVLTVPTPAIVLINNPGLPTGNSDEAKNAKFGVLRAYVKKTTKSSNKIQWSKLANADGYVVLGNRCNSGGKKYSYEVLSILNNNGITSYTHSNLTKDTYYKYIVQAYKMVAGKMQVLETSKTIHSGTKAKKIANVKAVKVNKAKVTLAKKGKKFKLKATQTKVGKKLVNHRKISFESSDTTIATVNSKGVITAKKKGKCTIYVYAQNGVYKKVTVKVKK